ncbi:MAG: TIGR04283 family arsenosugar biosynthesis glycosyltransferase [Phycisphaeraceae bacterium]
MNRTDCQNVHREPEPRQVAVVIPALNEAEAIGDVLDAIPAWVARVVVVDNGSTDATAAVAREHGAVVVAEPRRGYGAACLRGLSAAGMPDVVVFLDADRSDEPSEMDRLVEPIVLGEADLVIGSRVLGEAEQGSLSLPQRFGNALASFLLRRLWGQACTDLGPFRAIRFDALLALQMSDLDYGWTVQMQARAMRMGLKVKEVPVSYRRRIGQSKISGTLRGMVGAGTKILMTIGRETVSGRSLRFVRQRLLVFTRYPEPGTTKTRLIPALGAEGAAEFQRQMTRHTLRAARRWQVHAGSEIEVRFAGGDAAAMGTAFGDDLQYTGQGEGSLGQRLHGAFHDTLEGSADAAIAIGTDCPSLDETVLSEAFAALQTHDVVIGPATDGGYYLIGLRRAVPELFQDIDWGTERVLAQTKAVAKRLGLRVAWLKERADVDEPSDLCVWQSVQQEHGTSRSRAPRLSVIIPAIDEADRLPETLCSVGRSPLIETIVVDGGSRDTTIEVAQAHGARIVASKPGRAIQMNAGAVTARGELLLFLHADTRLPFGYLQQIETILAAPGVVAGAFRLAFDDTRFALRWIESAANWRSVHRQLPYGDQALFLPRQRFHDLGGFRELPVMEDYELIRRLRKQGRIAMAPSAVITSARRWLARGIWRTTLAHQRMILGWHLGTSPQRLAQWRAGTAREPAGVAGRSTLPLEHAPPNPAEDSPHEASTSNGQFQGDDASVPERLEGQSRD